MKIPRQKIGTCRSGKAIFTLTTDDCRYKVDSGVKKGEGITTAPGSSVVQHIEGC